MTQAVAVLTKNGRVWNKNMAKNSVLTILSQSSLKMDVFETLITSLELINDDGRSPH